VFPTPVLGPSARFLRAARDEQPWTGSPICLNLRDADLADLLKSFAELTGLSFVVYPEVRGTVTASLNDVPWDQALDLILRINGYGYVIEGRVVRIGPVKRLAQ
jgi:type IV pilus assembly protein PilQ